MKIPNDIIENSSRRSLILSELLSYLTEHNSPTDRSSKLKEFLHVFANIQTHPQLENCNTSDSLFLLLLKKLKSFVWDSVGSYPNKCDEQTEHRTLKAASNTIGAIAEKFINVSIP